MTINWYGQGCFRINSQANKSQAKNILIDLPEKESGLRGPKLEADILLISSGNEKSAGNYFLITGPGEYEVKGVYIEGIPAGTKPRSERDSSLLRGKEKKNTIYTIEAEEMKICHLDKFSQDELFPSQLESIGDVDILMIPIGGGEVIDAQKAIKIMAQVEPKIIIPMYYRIPGLKIKLNPLDNFLKALGIKSLEPLAKLSIKKKDISSEEAKIIVLKP